MQLRAILCMILMKVCWLSLFRATEIKSVYMFSVRARPSYSVEGRPALSTIVVGGVALALLLVLIIGMLLPGSITNPNVDNKISTSSFQNGILASTAAAASSNSSVASNSASNLALTNTLSTTTTSDAIAGASTSTSTSAPALASPTTSTSSIGSTSTSTSTSTGIGGRASTTNCTRQS